MEQLGRLRDDLGTLAAGRSGFIYGTTMSAAPRYIVEFWRVGSTGETPHCGIPADKLHSILVAARFGHIAPFCATEARMGER